MRIDRIDFSFQIHHLASLDSTNSELSRLLNKEILPEGYLIKCDFQHGGKGQNNALWESEKAKNLLFSFIIRPNMIHVSQQFYISMITSLALVDTINPHISRADIRIKWPNDIYIDSKKVAGILIENAIQGDTYEWVIIGIGLNVNQLHFLSDAPNPTSLKEETKQDFKQGELLKQFEISFAKYYNYLHRGELSIIREEYLQKMFQRNQWKEYEHIGQQFSGRILGVDEYGFLKIETPNGEQSFDVKDIKYYL